MAHIKNREIAYAAVEAYMGVSRKERERESACDG